MKEPFFWGRSRKEIGLLAVLVIFYLGLRLFSAGFEGLWPDESLYMFDALKITQNPGYLFSEQLFGVIWYFPLLVAGFFSALMGPIVGVKLMVILFGLTGVLAFYGLMRFSFDDETSFLAAMLFSAHNLFWLLTSKGLLDVPLMAMFLVTVYAAVKYDVVGGRRNAVLLGVASGLTLFTKVGGVLLYPILGIYFLGRFTVFGKLAELKEFVRRKDTLVGIGIHLAFLLLFFGNEFIHTGSFFSLHSGASAIKGAFFVGGAFQYINTFGSLFPLLLLPFVAYGGYLFVKRKEKPLFALLGLFLVVFLFFSLAVAEKDGRYVVAAIPPLYAFAAAGIVAFFPSRMLKVGLSALLVLFLVFQIGSGWVQTSSKGDTYTGFPEAGAKLLAAFPDNLTEYKIMVGSVRSMRLVTGLDLEVYGGSIRDFPRTEAEFNKILAEDKSVILVMDVWEFTQPSYIRDRSNGRFNRQTIVRLLNEEGFSELFSVMRPVPTNQGIMDVPVVVGLVRG